MKITKKYLHIAIDGPIGVGKSTLALDLAKKLNITYVYTGAMYRAVAYIAQSNNIIPENKNKLLLILKKSKLELKKASLRSRHTDVYLDGTDITSKLFTPQNTKATAIIARYSEIRNYLVHLQQQIPKKTSVVMDGRDIGTVVLPFADLKIYLSADISVRAKRRWRQLTAIGKPVRLKQVTKDIIERDNIDTLRTASPLTKTREHWEIDTANLTIHQTVDLVIKKLKDLNLVK